jgi:hypothetical protein
MFPEISALNLKTKYMLVYGYQTPTATQTVYSDASQLPNTSRSAIDWEKDIYLLTFEARKEHLTAAALAKYGEAISQLPIQYARRALSCVEVEILPGPYPDEIKYISINLEDWICAIEHNDKNFNCSQERGDLVDGAFRYDDTVVLAFDTCGNANQPYPDCVDGVRISASALLNQLKALQLHISLNESLIVETIKPAPMVWRFVKSIFTK